MFFKILFLFFTLLSLTQASTIANPDKLTISAGGSHTLVLSDNGDVYSFGNAISGQLAHVGHITQYSPKKIEILT